MNPIHKQEIPEEILIVTGELMQMTFPQQGCTSDVAVLECEHGKFVLKRSRGRYASWLEREVHILKSLSSLSLVPKVHAFREEASDNQAWLLMSYLQGETLGEALKRGLHPEEKRRLIFQFGKVLADIHSTACPVELLRSETVWLDEMLKRAEHDLQHFEVDGTPELLGKLMREKPRKINQTLIHGDFTVDNVMVYEGEISGIIDWSGGDYGDPRYDAALAIWPKEGEFEDERNIKLFFEGYGKGIINEDEYDYFANGLYEFL